MNKLDLGFARSCLLQRMSLFMAPNGHAAGVAACPLLRDERT